VSAGHDNDELIPIYVKQTTSDLKKSRKFFALLIGAIIFLVIMLKMHIKTSHGNKAMCTSQPLVFTVR